MCLYELASVFLGSKIILTEMKAGRSGVHLGVGLAAGLEFTLE